MSLARSSGKLAALTAELSRQWERTEPFWRDAKCEAFEKQTMDVIRSSVGVTIDALQKLDELMRKIRRECE